jgi:hypothetical protein
MRIDGDQVEDFPALARAVFPCGEITIELVDPPRHVRLPINDDEIVDRVLAIEPQYVRNGQRIACTGRGQQTGSFDKSSKSATSVWSSSTVVLWGGSSERE